MDNRDNSEWLESLLAAERGRPYPYQRLSRILNQESSILRAIAFIVSVFMFMVFLWALSLLDFIPGFSDVAKNLIDWLCCKYNVLKTMVLEAYSILLNTEWL